MIFYHADFYQRFDGAITRALSMRYRPCHIHYDATLAIDARRASPASGDMPSIGRSLHDFTMMRRRFSRVFSPGRNTPVRRRIALKHARVRADKKQHILLYDYPSYTHFQPYISATRLYIDDGHEPTSNIFVVIEK